MQALIVHWLLVVAGGEGLGLAGGPLLAATLVAGNLRLLPSLRRAREGSRGSRLLARLYTSSGIVTLLVGSALAALWLAAIPASALLSLAGVSDQTVFGLFRLGSSGLVLSLTGMLLWGFTFGQRGFEHSHVPVALPGLAAELRGLRILQLSDLHIGNGMQGEELAALVGRANALRPDCIVLTGDLFDFDPSCVEDGARGLSALQAPLGVYAVLGNHDVYTGAERVAGALAQHARGIRLLRGEWVRLPLPAPLYLAGVDDPGRRWAERDFELPALETLARELPGDGPALLLVHRPEAFGQAARLGFPLVLAGHTHGGQLAVPLLQDSLNLARLISRYPRGLFHEGGSLLYVNRGAGVAGPRLRLATRREIATIELF